MLYIALLNNSHGGEMDIYRNLLFELYFHALLFYGIWSIFFGISMILDKHKYRKISDKIMISVITSYLASVVIAIAAEIIVWSIYFLN